MTKHYLNNKEAAKNIINKYNMSLVDTFEGEAIYANEEETLWLVLCMDGSFKVTDDSAEAYGDE